MAINRVRQTIRTRCESEVATAVGQAVGSVLPGTGVSRQGANTQVQNTKLIALSATKATQGVIVFQRRPMGDAVFELSCLAVLSWG